MSISNQKFNLMLFLKNLFTENVLLLPEFMRPKQPVVFDEIFHLSVQNDPHAVRELGLRLRHHLDVAADYERSQLPLQQIEDSIKHNKRRDLIRESLSEQTQSHLT